LKKKNEAAEEEDDEPVEVIPVAESTPPRSPYKQMAQIQIGPRGQPTETLAPRAGAGQTGPTGSAVWPPPPPTPPSGPVTTTPPPPSSGDSSTAPPPQDPTAAGKQPPLRSPHRGPNPSPLRPPHEIELPGSSTGGLGSSSPALRAMGNGVGWWWSGEERRWCAAPVRRTEVEEAMRWGTGGCFQKELRCTIEKGAGACYG
jgi:hypothetical protein